SLAPLSCHTLFSYDLPAPLDAYTLSLHDALPIYSSWLEETAASLAEDADIAVLVRLAAWSPDPLPWVPDPTTVSAADNDGFLAEKKRAAAARDAAFEEASQALVSAIEVAGGGVEARLSGVGTLSGHVPAGALAALAAR